MDIFDAIKNRRSIRRYRPDPVDEATLNKVLEAGRWAPSWANTQCWRFVVARDPAVREALAGSLSKIKLPDRELENPAAGAFRTVPVVIVVAAKTGTAGYAPDGAPATDKGDWFMHDAALATQNMVLAAHALGLGTVIIGAFDAKKAEAALNLPEGYRAVVMLPLGVPDHEGKAPPRKELGELVIRDKWDK